MTDTKYPVAGVLVDAVTRNEAQDRILAAARDGRPFSATALAVHGVMTGVDDPEHRYRLNRLDLVTPDGQPVRWALNWLHGTALTERVYGPTLMKDLCRRAADERLPVYLFGSTTDVIALLSARLTEEFPSLVIAGAEPSSFRQGSDDDAARLAERISASGARLCFVGLGCPRQEVFVYEMTQRIGVPVIAVGAAFEYHAGVTQEPPMWVQNAGLQWAHRLARSPRRLAHRYLVLSPRYVGRVLRQRLGRPAALPDEAEPRQAQHWI